MLNDNDNQQQQPPLLGIKLSLPSGTSNSIRSKRSDILNHRHQQEDHVNHDDVNDGGCDANGDGDGGDGRAMNIVVNDECDDDDVSNINDDNNNDGDDDDDDDDGLIEDEDRMIMPFQLQRDDNSDDSDNDNDNDENSNGNNDQHSVSTAESSVSTEFNFLCQHYNPLDYHDDHEDDHEDDDDACDENDKERQRRQTDRDAHTLLTRPALSLNLEALIGYDPKDLNQDEQNRIVQEIRHALLGADCDNDGTADGGNGNRNQNDVNGGNDINAKENQNQKEKQNADVTSLDFVEKSAELFDAGIAHHCTLPLVMDDNHDDDNHGDHDNYDPRAIVHYPEFLPISVPITTTTAESGSDPTNNETDDEPPQPQSQPQPQPQMQTILMATATIWKRINHPHTKPIIQKLLTNLSQTSRPLIWKYNMMHEIRSLARRESIRSQTILTNRKVYKWRMQTRPKELERLYEVRDVVEARLEKGRERYDGFVRDRECRVAVELRRRVELVKKQRNNSKNGNSSSYSNNGERIGGVGVYDKENGAAIIGTGGIAGLDWDSHVTFGFGEDVEEVIKRLMEERQGNGTNTNGNGTHGMIGGGQRIDEEDYDSLEEDEYEDSDYNDDDDYDDYGYNYEDDDDHDHDDIIDSEKVIKETRVATGTIKTNGFDLPQSSAQETSVSISTSVSTSIPISMPTTSLLDRKKRRAAAAAKRHRKRLQKHSQSQSSTTSHEQLKLKIERAYAEEEHVRNKLISTDERLAESTVMHLEQKLKQVDDLLELMQEEEWKDEEEGLLLDRDEDDFDGNDNDVDNDVDDDDDDSEIQASILHPILAMILGALPDHGKSPEEHFSHLKKVHTEIVNGWKKEFGRLPPLSDDNDNENDDHDYEHDKNQTRRHENRGPHADIDNKDPPSYHEASDGGGWKEEEFLKSKMRDLSLNMMQAQTASIHAASTSTSNSNSNANSNWNTNTNTNSNSNSLFGPSAVPDDWEDAADDDILDGFGFDFSSASQSQSKVTGILPSADSETARTPAPAAPRVGLRPGGKIK